MSASTTSGCTSSVGAELHYDAGCGLPPRVTGELAHWRTYAAAPLLTPDELVIGTLCVFDEEPRELTPAQLRGLADLADQVVALFDLRRYAKQVSDAAAHDALTGLPNRVILEGQMGHALAVAARRHGSPVALVLDLNGFKAVNDTYGHEAGDEVLREPAGHIHRAVRLEETVARPRSVIRTPVRHRPDTRTLAASARTVRPRQPVTRNAEDAEQWDERYAGAEQVERAAERHPRA